MAAAEDVTFFYETHYQVRSLRPEAPVVLDTVHRKGIRLAIISNIISRRLVQCKLVEYGIVRYFDPVVTSSGFGWRKPKARIFEEVARLMQLPPATCAYVGDTISRDAIGARRAGYGLVIEIKSFVSEKADRGIDVESTSDRGLLPDAIIHDLTQVIGPVTTNMERPSGH